MKLVPRVTAVALFAAAACIAPASAGADSDASRPRRASIPLGEEVRRDRQELESFEEILGVLESTAAQKNRKEYMKLDLALHAAMVQEVEEAAAKAERARRESDGTPAERALARSAARDGGPDLSTAEGRHERMRDLVREAENLLPGLRRWDGATLARNRDLLREFFDAMVADLRASGGEWKAEKM
jgi:hypothetical protein